MVQVAGLEPVRVAPLEPESSASANSAIPADIKPLDFYTAVAPEAAAYFD